MNYRNSIAISFLLIMTVLFFGCSTTEETAEKPNQETPPPVAQQQPVQPPPSRQIQPTRTDTVSITTQVTGKDTLQQTAPPESVAAKSTSLQSPSPAPTGNFAVQIGAFSVADKAGIIASLAKGRFQKNVYTLQAKDTGLYKVMVGDFMTKDEARKFRDQMAQQFPDDYKDAWVAPIPTEK
ncbi:MAG: SPOR domain-containing protein [Bacteroidota bacterium]|jgi:cell division septation protein DedD